MDLVDLKYKREKMIDKKNIYYFNIVLITIFGIYFMNWLTKKPIIIYSLPNNNATNIDIKTDSIIIKSNTRQDWQKNKISIEPSISYKILPDKNKTVVLVIDDYLNPYTQYDIKVALKNKLNKEFIYKISFKTEFIEWKKLPKELQDKELELMALCEEGSPDFLNCPLLKN
jgi:hypothetical protein